MGFHYILNPPRIIVYNNISVCTLTKCEDPDDMSHNVQEIYSIHVYCMFV